MTRKIYCSYTSAEQLKKYPPDWDGADVEVVLYDTAIGIGPEKINYLNNYWSDYVCMYDVWKNNLKSDFVGFEQYSRRLDYKMLVTEPDKCNVFHRVSFPATVADMYRFFHDYRDMIGIAQIMLEQTKTDASDPLSNPYVKYLYTERVFYSESTFFMSWDKFTAMCEFMFPILFAYDKSMNLGMDVKRYEEWTKTRFAESKYALKANASWEYQRRVFGYLAERLVSAFIHVNFDKGKIIESSSDHTGYEAFIRKRVANGDYNEMILNSLKNSRK